MATMATNHVTVAMGQVATISLPRYSHFFISNYIIPSHYDQMLFFSVYTRIKSEKVEIAVTIAHITWHFANTYGHFDFLDLL